LSFLSAKLQRVGADPYSLLVKRGLLVVFIGLALQCGDSGEDGPPPDPLLCTGVSQLPGGTSVEWHTGVTCGGKHQCVFGLCVCVPTKTGGTRF
jgi:hypothetical protein